jgi:hypothetical protein
VRIVHEFRKGWPVLDRFVSERVVGAFFVSAIASRTLSMVKLLAEADQLAHRGPLAPTLDLDDQPAAFPDPDGGP